MIDLQEHPAHLGMHCKHEILRIPRSQIPDHLPCIKMPHPD